VLFVPAPAQKIHRARSQEIDGEQLGGGTG
jgi:hypothetical protein